MRRLLAALLAISLWLCVVPAASAYNLIPCSESAAFQERAEYARPTTGDPNSAKERFERYSQALCGENDGLPHLIVDGSLNRLGDFIIPSLMFLYIAGWIGWAGRSYLIAIKGDKNVEDKEIIIDVPLATKFMIGSFVWPLAALKEITTGEMFAKDDEITVSPR